MTTHEMPTVRVETDGREDGGRRRRIAALVAIPAALLVSSALVYQSSMAAFTAQTDTGSNSWNTGSVALTSDKEGVAVFNVNNMSAGVPETRCIVVTYSGDLTSDVRLYVSAVSAAGLREYLDLTVEEGTGGGSGTDNCDGFVKTADLDSGTDTLASFAAAHDDFGSGVSDWAAPAETTRTYRFTTTVQDDPNAMGKSATATFRWEAQG